MNPFTDKIEIRREGSFREVSFAHENYGKEEKTVIP
jgi:hypothetical protein